MGMLVRLARFSCGYVPGWNWLMGQSATDGGAMTAVAGSAAATTATGPASIHCAACLEAARMAERSTEVKGCGETVAALRWVSRVA